MEEREERGKSGEWDSGEKGGTKAKGGERKGWEGGGRRGVRGEGRGEDHTASISKPLYTLMLPELHVVKVLFYAKSVGVVISGHMTKMAVTLFDPPRLKTPY